MDMWIFDANVGQDPSLTTRTLFGLISRVIRLWLWAGLSVRVFVSLCVRVGRASMRSLVHLCAFLCVCQVRRPHIRHEFIKCVVTGQGRKVGGSSNFIIPDHAKVCNTMQHVLTTDFQISYHAEYGLHDAWLP